LKINNDKTSIVAISITDPTVKKAEVFLDNLIQIYNEDVAEDKFYFRQHFQIYCNRLRLIAVELDGVENNVEDFKTSNELTDINSEAKLYIEGSNEYDKKGIEAEIQLNVVSSMLNFEEK
jgi:uncharacterized protein involved in exopolysaccharide biosynthesis